MAGPVRTGIPVLGVIFLVLAAIKLVTGGPWVVWAILAFLFGGFSVLGPRKRGEGAH